MYSVTDERLPSCDTCDTSQHQAVQITAMEGIYKVTDNVYKILKVCSLSLLVFGLIPKLGGEWESHGTSGTDDLSSTTSVRRLR